MKTKTICFSAIILTIICVFNCSGTLAQASKDLNATGDIQQKVTGNTGGNYTYRVFIAPNKLYGYDIFLAYRVIFHQPAMAEPTGNKDAALTKKDQADRAAALAIEKIKKGQPAQLTRDELTRVTGY